MKVGEIGNFIKNQSVRKDKVFDFIKQIFLRKFSELFFATLPKQLNYRYLH